MNSKTFSVFLLTVLVVSILASFALALTNPSTSTPATLSKSVNSTTFTITNNEVFPLTITVILPSNINDSKNIILISTNSQLNFQLDPGAGNATTINISRGAVPTAFYLGDSFSSNIIVNAVNAVNSSITYSIPPVPLNFLSTFCVKGDIGNGIEITKLTDEKIDNVDEWKWNLLDNVEITVKVKNTLDEDIDLTLEYGLYDFADNSFIDINEDTVDFSIDNKDTKDITLNFKVPASELDFDASKKIYRFYVKVYEEGEEDKRCTDIKSADYYKEADIKKDSRDVVVDNIKTVVPSALCGDTVDVDADAVNVGRNDEDRVKVRLYNKELGVNIEKEFKNLDVGDSEPVNFEFNVPKNVTEKIYKLELTTYFDYDEDTESYDKSSDKDFFVNLKVEGNCVQLKPSVSILPSLESTEVNAGQEVVIKATVKNTGTATTTYTMTVSGNELWSSINSINPQSLTLDAGKSQDVLITLLLNKDASGDKTFNIKAIYSGQTTEQPVSLTIQAQQGFLTGLTGSAIGESIKQSWFIWLIVLINVILIIAIIIVAVKVSRA